MDSGISGYTGENRTIGALGRILEGINDGLIPRDTHLLIEQWDRLSREHRRPTQRLIEDILDRGIKIVTLNDGQVWSIDGYDDDISLVIRLLLSLEQAHKFSENLSRRLTAAWRSNTEKVRDGTRKRTRAAPKWLRFLGTLDDGSFEIIPDVAATVIEVYTRYANGETTYSIATDLRKRGVPLISGKHSGWRQSNIRKIVSSKAPYGILELGKGRKNNRILTGEMIHNYFPRIVDEEVQRLVQWRLNKPKASRHTDETANLNTKAILTGLAWFDVGSSIGFERIARGVSNSGKGTHITMITRKYVGAQAYIERRFLEGWGEIAAALDVESTPELANIDAALLVAYENLENALKGTSERLRLAAQADVEELEEAQKEQRRATLLSSLDIPDLASEIRAMAPHEANQLLRSIIKRIEISKGKTDKPKLGAPLWFDVLLKNGHMVSFGDGTAIFKDSL